MSSESGSAGWIAVGLGARVPACADGRVHSVFRRACNIETRSGELIALVAAEFGDLPHGIRCALPATALSATNLRPGQAAIFDDAMLRVPAAGLVVDASAAPIWHGDLSDCGVDAGEASVRRGLAVVKTALCGRTPEGGLAPLLRAREAPRSPIACALSRRLDDALPRLAAATRAADAQAAHAALARLVGLGPGLTPAGDDFIVGYLAALWSRSRQSGGIDALLRALGAPVAQLTLRTHAISRQLLLDAVHGRFAERLADVVHALRRGTEVARATQRALEVGHSSGADTLCGLLFGYSAATDAPRAALAATGKHRGDRGVLPGAATAC